MTIDLQTAIAAAAESVQAEPGAPGSAWRVDRLDREGQSYYLVLIEGRGGEASIVTVDGESGEVESWARLGSGGSPLTLSPERAAKLANLYPADEIALVWMPCVASRSALDPLWRVKRGEVLRYVDQRGTVWNDLRSDRRGG